MSDQRIGVFVTGDFRRTPPEAGQARKLRLLIAALRARLNISADRLYRHGDLEDVPQAQLPF